MPLYPITADKAPAAAGPYSQGIIAGQFVFVSGQLPIVPETKQLISGDIEKATAQSLENCKSILEGGMAGLENVVKVDIFLTNMADFGKVNAVYEKYFSSHKPARACVQVAALPLNAEIEIQMVAYKE